MKSPGRAVFRLIIALHPHEFRTEFGEEMLWIFDEQMASERQRSSRFVLFAQMLLDVLRSAFLQHFLRERLQVDAVGPRFVQIENSAGMEAAFLVVCSLFNLMCICLALRMVLTNL